MVFDAVTQSLSGFTDTITNSVKNPLQQATDSVTKRVIGPRLDILETVQDELYLQTFIVEAKLAIKAQSKLLQTKKVSAKKVKEIESCMDELLSQEFTSFENAFESIESSIHLIKKNVQEGIYPSKFEGKKLVFLKKNKLTVAEKPVLVTAFGDLENTYRRSHSLLKNGYETYIHVGVHSTKKQVTKKFYTQKKNLLQTIHEDSIDASLSLIREWKKYNGILKIAQKNNKYIQKLKDKKQSAFGPEKKKFDSEIAKMNKETAALLTIQGGAIMQGIQKLEQTIEELYEKAALAIQGYHDAYLAEKEGLTKELAKTHRAALTARTKQIKSKNSFKKKIDSIVKKEIATMSALEKKIDAPYTNAGGAAKDIAVLHKLFNDQEAHKNDFLIAHLKQVYTAASIHIVYEELIDLYHQYVYDESLLIRMTTVYIGLTNRYHSKHASLAKDTRNKMLDLKRGNAEIFGKLVTQMQKRAEYYNSKIKRNEKEVRKNKAQLQSYKKSQWKLIKFIQQVDLEKKRIKSLIEADVYAAQSASIRATINSQSEHLKNMEKKESAFHSLQKRTDTELGEKEKTMITLGGAAIKKEVKALHTKKEQQEVLFSLYSHYIEELDNHLIELQGMKSGYVKLEKKRRSETKSLAKKAKSDNKKVVSSQAAKSIEWKSLVDSDLFEVE